MNVTSATDTASTQTTATGLTRSAVATMCSGLPTGSRSHGSFVPGRFRFETLKPVSPALGLEPRPVAPSSRISPPAPVEAPGNGEMAVGWLCVSTFITVCTAPPWRA